MDVGVGVVPLPAVVVLLLPALTRGYKERVRQALEVGSWSCL